MGISVACANLGKPVVFKPLETGGMYYGMCLAIFVLKMEMTDSFVSLAGEWLNDRPEGKGRLMFSK